MIQPNLKLKLLSAQVLRPEQKNFTFPCIFPAKCPALAESSIAQPLLIRIQPNLKLKLLLAQVSRPKQKNTFPCIFPAKCPALAESSIFQPILIRIQPNLKLKLLLAKVSRPKQKNVTFLCIPEMPGICQIKHSSAITPQNSTKFET